MGYYLIEGSYTGASAKAMVGSPSDRSAQAKSLVESLGGKFHHYFLAFGESDYVTLCEMPDDIAAASVSLALGSTGAFSKTKTTKLLTSEEAQTAMKKAQSARYASPSVA